MMAGVMLAAGTDDFPAPEMHDLAQQAVGTVDMLCERDGIQVSPQLYGGVQEVVLRTTDHV
jgi:hypothetical protein